MKGDRFQPSVIAHVDEDGDSTLEIIWEDRRLLILLNPSQKDKNDYSWFMITKNPQFKMQEGNDLASMHEVLVDLAKWQKENDEHEK